jgi:hypothetical protein
MMEGGTDRVMEARWNIVDIVPSTLNCLTTGMQACSQGKATVKC